MTAPGHATLGTGSYVLGHGILGNEWWDPELRRMVTSVEDGSTRPLGLPEGVTGEKWSASPHNLQTDTIGDELKLATGGKAKVYGLALKDRAAILPVGFSANAAFFLDPQSGAFVTSTYYMKQAPEWLVSFNAGNTRESYLNREVKDAAGNVLRSTAPVKNAKGKDASFYELVGPTPWGNDYTVDLAKQIIEHEKLGSGAVSDLISISFSSPDILGHKVGPDSPEHKAMLMALDHTLAGFFEYLDAKVGKGNWAAAFSADHGIAPMSDYAGKLRIPAFNFNPNDLQDTAQRHAEAEVRQGRQLCGEHRLPDRILDSEAFAAVKVKRGRRGKNSGRIDAASSASGITRPRRRWQPGKLKNSIFRQQILNSYSPLAGWYRQRIHAAVPDRRLRWNHARVAV